MTTCEMIRQLIEAGVNEGLARARVDELKFELEAALEELEEAANTTLYIAQSLHETIGCQEEIEAVYN